MATGNVPAKREGEQREIAIKRLMEAADKDPKLRAEFLKAPKEFAARQGITLQHEEVEQLTRVGELVRVIDQFTAGRINGPGPIFYPVDVWWKAVLADHVLNYQPLFHKLFPPRGYPIGPVFRPQEVLSGPGLFPKE